jgi:hypothetical protein
MPKWLISAFMIVGLLLSQPISTLAAPDVSGKWHFVLDTPGGDREVEAVFQGDGDRITGKWGKEDVSGTFTAGKLDLSFPITAEETGEKGTLKITGKLLHDQLVGDWQFSDYNGTYKASREK